MLNSKSIGTKISEARKKMNLSQAELADGVSLSAQAVGKWERGESMPDISTLNRLAKILGVDLNYFSDSFPSDSSIKMEEGWDSQTKTKNHHPINSWDMSQSSWIDADFSGLSNLKEKLSSSNIKKSKFTGSDLSDLLLSSNDIGECDFSDSNLRNSKFNTSSISKSLFMNANLVDAFFSKCDINNCNFSNSNFSGTEFETVDFNKNNINEAIWKHTSFKTSSLSDLVFEGVMEDCSFENCSFKNVTFQNLTLKNTFFKHNRKLNRVQFINCQADNLSYAFLKSGKADLSGIELMES